jgi:hypothetical protein
MKQFISGIILIIGFSGIGFSQTDTVSRNSKWNFTVTSGLMIGGPAHEIQEELWHQGFGLEKDSYALNYPPVSIEAGRNFGRNLRMGLKASLFSQELTNWDDESSFLFRIMSLNPSISFNFKDILFIGAGPTLDYIDYSHTAYYGTTDGMNYVNGGFTFRSFFEYPKNKRVLFRMEMQYSYLLPIKCKYEIMGVGTSQTRRETYYIDNLPVRYLYAGLGVGVRLFH